MNTDYRPCIASDVDTAVPLIYSSGPNQFRYVFSVDEPLQALDFMRYCFISGKGQFGYRNFTAVVLDDQQVGIGSLWTHKRNLAFMLTSARQIIAFYGLRKGLRVIIRGLRIEQVVKPARRASAYIGFLGIDEAMRGRGLGRQLISYFFKQAIDMGFNKAALDVACDNRRARKLYESMGFGEVEENHSSLENEHGHVVTHYYMEVDLQALPKVIQVK